MLRPLTVWFASSPQSVCDFSNQSSSLCAMEYQEKHHYTQRTERIDQGGEQRDGRDQVPHDVKARDQEIPHEKGR